MRIRDKQAGEIIREAARKIAGETVIDVYDVGAPKTAFGEMSTSEPTPTMQIDALQGIRDDIIQTFTGGAGTVGVKDDHGGKEFKVTSGTTVGGYGLIRSKYLLRYRPGQGAAIRFTARWGTPVALSSMRAGGIGVGTELSFGYNGLDFGLLHRTGGRLELQTLTISTPAGGAETLTLTLDGTEYPISLTAGTAAHNAYEIVTDDSFSATHDAFQNGDTVIFIALSVGPKVGAYTFSSDGAAVGSFVELANGVAVTDNFVNQADWNVTTLLSTEDPFILDPTKGNVFQITYQYLGYGMLTFYVENPSTGMFIPVHRFQYANANAVPSLDTPMLKVGWFAASLGSTTDIEMYGASGAGFVEGKLITNKNSDAHFNTKTVSTTLTSVLQVRVRPTFNGYLNLNEIFPQLAKFAVDGTKPAICKVLLNPTVDGTPNWTYHNENGDLAEYDIAGTAVTGGLELAISPVAKSGSDSINLNDLNIKLSRNDIICLAVQATSGNTDASVSLTWVED